MGDIIGLLIYCAISVLIFLIFVGLGIMLPNFIKHTIKKNEEKSRIRGYKF